MASRVNTKFLLILIVSVVFIAGIAGGLFYLQYRGDAERHIRRGDELMAAGEYRDAYRSYGRTVAKNRSNMAYLDKFTEALLKVEPKNRDDAIDLYTKRRGALAQAVRYFGFDAAPHLALLEELSRSARLKSDDAESWAELGDAADEMDQQVADTDPDKVEARLYRGIATFRRSLLIVDTELDEAVKDLKAYIESRPESDAGHSALIRCYLSRSEKARIDGSDQDAELYLDESRRAVERATEAVPNGPDVARAVVLYMAVRRAYDENAVGRSELAAAVDHMVSVVRESGDELLILEAAEILSQIDVQGSTESRGRAIELLREYVATHPEAVFHRLTLTELLYRGDELEEASEMASALVNEDRRLTVSFSSVFEDELRRRAASTLVRIAKERWRQAPDDGRREAFEQIEAAAQGLADITPDPENDALCIEAQGYVAFARSDFRTAATRFMRLYRDGNASDQILAYAARSLEEIGEFGVAYDLKKELAARNPANTQYLYGCATSAYELRKWEEASRWIDELLEADPGHAEGQRLRSLIMLAQRGNNMAPDAAGLDAAGKAIAEAEAAMAEGQVESARSILLDAFDADPENANLMMALLRAEMTAGRKEQARAYVQDLLERYPDNRSLRQIAASLESDNRVEAIERYVDSLELGDDERIVTILLHLESLENVQRGRAVFLENNDRAEEAEEARMLADEAAEAARRYLAEADQLDPRDYPQLQEYLFRQALADADWVRAEELVQAARTSNADQAGGALFAGQLALQRERYADAVRWLRQATRDIPFSSAAWRGLAVAYQRQGNFGEAKRAFEQAYGNNPNDVDTVQRYVDLLLRTGDQASALRIMRTAHRLVPDDVVLRERWLQLETVAGDAALSLRTRRQIHDENPGDRSNAKQLATFLATARPYRELIFDQDGTERYSQLEWRRLSAVERQQIVRRVKEQWFASAQEILDELEQQIGRRPSVVALRAVLLREQGRVDEGQEVLESFITQTPEDELTVEMFLALGLYQADIGRIADAVETLDRGRQYQDAVEREADGALGNLYFSRGDYEKALEAYSRAVQVNPDAAVQLRVIECLASLGRFQQAQDRLDARMTAGESGYPEQMLAAAIHNGYGESLLRLGNADEAKRQFEKRDAAWEKAEELSPSNSGPHVQRALAKLNEARRVGPDQGSRTTELLREALRSLDRADEIRAGEAQTSMTRVAILQAMGDSQAAINELTRLVEASPHEVDARRRLVQLHNFQGNLDRALDTVDEGIQRNPALTVWHEMKGDLHLEQVLRMQQKPSPTEEDRRAMADGSKQAATAYRQAVAIEASPPLLGKLVGALINSRPPGYAEAVTVLDEHRDLLGGRPGDERVVDAAMLKSLYARALNGAGRRDDARKQLGEAYQLFRSAPNPDAAASAMTQWYRGVSEVFAGQPVAEIEQFVMDQAPPQPGASECSWLAGLFSAQGTSESIRRALELQRRAVEVYDGADNQVRAGLYYNLAIFLVLDRQYQAAVEPFKQAIDADANHRLALNNYAYLLADELRRPEDALPHAERAASLLTPRDPDAQWADVLDTLGWIQFLLGDANKADSTLRESMKRAETASNCYHLAAVLADKDRLDAARTYLDRASELRPDPRTKAEIDALADDIRTRRK